MPGDRERAQQQDQADDRVRQQVEPGPEGAAQPGLLHLRRPAPALAWLACWAAACVAAAERLEHPDAGRGLLDVGGQVALLVLGAPGQHPVPPLEPGADHHHGQEHAPGQQPEPPVQPDQQRDDGDERHHVGDEEDDAEPGEPPDRRQVRRGPGQQLAGLPLVVEPGVQPLQVRVQAVPHRPFHAGDRAGLHPPPVQVEPGLGHAQRDRGQAQGQQGARAPVRDRPVDDRLDQQRDRDLGGGRPDRRGEHQRQRAVVRPQVLPGSPERGQRRLRGRIRVHQCPPGRGLPGRLCPVWACGSEVGGVEGTIRRLTAHSTAVTLIFAGQGRVAKSR